jgi:hypothetical protein
MKFLKRHWIAISVAMFAYSICYVALRADHVLIHRASFDESSSHIRYFHWIEPGHPIPDFIDGRPVVVTSIFFYPIELVESLAWHFIPREYESRSGYIFGGSDGLKSTK